jgi:hypothetical protein
MEHSVQNRAWLRNFKVISSTNMQCTLCETGVPVGMGVWDTTTKTIGWSEGPWDLATFETCAMSHLFECPQWREAANEAVRNHSE